MAITTTVLYPNKPDITFDLSYYLTIHMKMAEKLWGPLGMKTWVATQFQAGADGTKPPFFLSAVSEWTSREASEAAFASEAGETLLKDIQNFTNATPVLLTGDVKGGWS